MDGFFTTRTWYFFGWIATVTVNICEFTMIFRISLSSKEIPLTLSSTSTKRETYSLANAVKEVNKAFADIGVHEMNRVDEVDYYWVYGVETLNKTAAFHYHMTLKLEKKRRWREVQSLICHKSVASKHFTLYSSKITGSLRELWAPSGSRKRLGVGQMSRLQGLK